MTDRTRSASLRAALGVAVAAIVILQVIRVAQSAYPLLINKAWVNRHMDAVERSADAAYGQGYLSAIRALRLRIPTDGTVVLTGTIGLPQYEARDFMQYFLFPRKVELLDCPGGPAIEDCILSTAGARVYFLVGDSLQDTSRLEDRLIITPIGAGVRLIEPQGTND